MSFTYNAIIIYDVLETMLSICNDGHMVCVCVWEGEDSPFISFTYNAIIIYDVFEIVPSICDEG